MNEEEKRKCSCPYCPGHGEIQRYGDLQLEPVATRWPTQPCRQCSGPIWIVGDFICPGCGTQYKSSHNITFTSTS